MPWQWMTSRICEEFGCTPLEALDQPVELTFQIMDLRAYQRTKAALESAPNMMEIEQTPMVMRVIENMGLIGQEAMRKRAK